ncbi:aldo/keto reductase [Sphingomonas quercus]|uniref:Aldo/keto reductase n=1 Tax=Sphingomonas quercus TaxID=2842451 RepID=A0ABS6BK71_9SPHN|nr:aldo/keto reductase [Sphingomonas quercus]MBU3078559.1 aldo/keto reductase [Sphingomonas quercus]
MMDRRTLLAGLAAAPLIASRAMAQAPAPLITRRIPGIAEPLPIVGIGTARRYENPEGEAALAPLRETIRRFHQLGGRIIDMAPSYGRAESVVGELVAGLGNRRDLIFSTKVGADSKEAGRQQIEQSFRNLRTDRIDLFFVHNIRDVDNQLATLAELKQAGRIRALGITTSFDQQYQAFEAVMRRARLDCIQVDYALDNRGSAERILPLAQERGMAVMVNLPFGRDRLFNATNGKPLPDWAKDIGCTSWAQVFLKYVLSHPAVTCVVPGMSQARYVDDNLGAARGRMPDAAMRRRMEQFIDAL